MGIMAWFLAFVVAFSFSVWLIQDQPALLPTFMTQAIVVILPFLCLFAMGTEFTDELNDTDDAPTKFAKAQVWKVKQKIRKKKNGYPFYGGD